jgi:signal transduction histidine kinase
MEIVLDFAAEKVPPSSPGSLQQLDQLARCYRKALGHELPNLLVALQGLARTLELEQGERLDDEGRAYLDRIIQAAQKADTLTRTLAGLGKLAGPENPPEPVALDDLVQEAVAEMTIACRGQVIEWRTAANLPAVLAPRSALRYALVQVLRNAVQGAAVGRDLCIAIEASLRGAQQAAAGGVELSVRDNGAGMTAEQMQRLFEPFAPGRSPKGGFGLGLFAVRQLVAGWQGGLRIRSEPGIGTEVGLFCPPAATVGA